MEYDKTCMYCNHTKHENNWYNQKDYQQIKTTNQQTHGLCQSEVCRLEHAMKGSGIMHATKELPEENIYLLDDLIRIIDTIQ